VSAAKQNHPDSPFLNSIELLERSEGKYQLQILFTQLRIALEALQQDPVPTRSSDQP
jgi:hypothetical protein